MTTATVSLSREPSAEVPGVPFGASSRGQDLTGARLQDLFEEHHRLIFGTAYRVTGNANDAEDVLQTIFLRLLKRPPAALETGNAAGYLRRAAINASLDLIRSRKRSRLVALDQQLIEDMKPAVDGASDPGRRYAGLELRERLRRELAKANPRAAQMFVLRYFEGYRNSEIGPMMATSRMTVAVTLHRLRKRLRLALADESSSTENTAVGAGPSDRGRHGTAGREEGRRER